MSGVDFNIVTLSVHSYNQIKADNYRLNMLLGDLLQNAMISEDHQHMVFDSEKVEYAIKFCFGDTYKKRLATLRTNATKYGTGIASEGGTRDD